MMMKNLRKFRDTAVLAASIVFCLAVATYFAFEVYVALDTGVAETRRHVVGMANDPTAFWIVITLHAFGMVAFAFFAAFIAIIGFRIYKKGMLFVANEGQTLRKPGSRSAIAPLIDEANTTTIDR